MSNYTKTTDFQAKDSLPSGDSAKVIRGSEFETEFDAISTAIATKSDIAGPTFTGTLTFETISDGTINVTAFVDEDNMASNSATLIPTQQSVKAYVDAQVATADALSEVLGNGNTTGGTDIAVGTGDDITFADSSKAIFGAGSDLQIYHDASDSIINDNGTGSLKLQTGASTKLEVTSTGIDVTGTATMDGLTVTSGSSSDNIMQVFGGGTIYAGLGVDGTGAILTAGSSGSADSDLIIKTSSSGTEKQRARFQDNGDISFYEDTGTTAKLFWDASAESLGIGTSSPTHNLHIEDSSTTQIKVKNTTNNAEVRLGSSSTGGDGFVGTASNDDLSIITNNSTRMTIDTSGNVGIGASSPAHELDVNGTVNAERLILDSETITSSSNAATIDLSTGDNFVHDLTENVTYTFSNPGASGKVSAFSLKVIQGSTARTITWPSSVDWAAGTAPTLSTANDAVDVFVFFTHDGGTTYYGFTAGQAMA